MTDQPRGLQTDLLKCSLETRQYVLGLGAEIEQLRAQLERGKASPQADIVDQFMGLTLADYRKVVEERDDLLIQKRVLLDAIDSWKEMNTAGRRERDVAQAVVKDIHNSLRRAEQEADRAREAARLFWPYVTDVSDDIGVISLDGVFTAVADVLKRYPWLEEDE